MNLNEKYEILKKTALEQWNNLKDSEDIVIYVGNVTCGRAAGSQATISAFVKLLEENNIKGRVVPVGCNGHCYAEPIVIIQNPGFPPLMYKNINPGEAGVLVRAFLLEGDPCFDYLIGSLIPDDNFPTINDYPRFLFEKKVVMDLCGYIDPYNIYHYIANDGYNGLVKALGMSQKDIIEEIKNSKLRGRGGAGFPTGVKWEITYNAKGNFKTIICNGDEGDPGAYMDRTIMESNPHQLLEGILIGAYAIGAENAILYIRAEYPLAVNTVKAAINDAKKLNLLGENILGTGISINVSVFQGAGAFVCGEETALIESIEGRRGMPRIKPPYPAEKGFRDEPTLINNVKTLSNIPYIIKKGADKFKEIGTENSPGTAIFSIVGDVNYPGLVEIPMGVTLNHLIFDICGGIKDDKNFKAVQIGGPSGGCLPEKFLETPIDFDSLKKAGAMMGSGGMVIMDDTNCMVEVARYFLDFTQKESCGKCTFCRIGTRQLLEILHRITIGEGTANDLNILEELCEVIIKGSLCGLGKTAPNPVLTTLRYFRDEYLAHIEEKQCPALMCRKLIAFYIDLEKCARGCDACVGCCPTEAIFTTKKSRKKAIDQEKCVKCGECVKACPPEYDAVEIVSPPELAPIITEE
jgi:NADH-quinone oxidoreductase subunit F